MKKRRKDSWAEKGQNTVRRAVDAGGAKGGTGMEGSVVGCGRRKEKC
jgi:hypothetical protein